MQTLLCVNRSVWVVLPLHWCTYTGNRLYISRVMLFGQTICVILWLTNDSSASCSWCSLLFPLHIPCDHMSRNFMALSTMAPLSIIQYMSWSEKCHPDCWFVSQQVHVLSVYDLWSTWRSKFLQEIMAGCLSLNMTYKRYTLEFPYTGCQHYSQI